MFCNQRLHFSHFPMMTYFKGADNASILIHPWHGVYCTRNPPEVMWAELPQQHEEMCACDNPEGPGPTMHHMNTKRSVKKVAKTVYTRHSPKSIEVHVYTRHTASAN